MTLKEGLLLKEGDKVYTVLPCLDTKNSKIYFVMAERTVEDVRYENEYFSIKIEGLEWSDESVLCYWECTPELAKMQMVKGLKVLNGGAEIVVYKEGTYDKNKERGEVFTDEIE